MASGQTSRYGLSQWQPEDKVLREEFNGDNGKVDAALGGLADQMNTKAGQADLDGVKTQLATKAAQSALNSLSASVTAGLAKKYGTDNPYIKTGSYVGDGTFVRSITVGFRPSLVMIFSMDCDNTDYNHAFLLGDDSVQVVIPIKFRTKICQDWLQFTDTGFTLHLETTSYSHFNSQDLSFYYIALK